MGMIEFELLAYPKRDFEDSSRITEALNSHEITSIKEMTPNNSFLLYPQPFSSLFIL